MRFVFIILSLSLLFSCQPQEPVSTEKIDTLEAKMRQLDYLDTALAQKLVQEYEAYAQKTEDDSMATVMMYREANLLKEMSAEYREKALQVLIDIEQDYPQHNLAPRAAFMRAFVNDESLQRKEKAAQLYGEFVEKYPDHPLAKDAQLLKEMALKTDSEQLQYIRDIVKKAKVDSATKK